MMPTTPRLPFSLRDLQQEPPAGRCAQCGGELYRWESIYFLEGDLICQDCLTDYARRHFEPCLTPMEEVMAQ